jgi:hypothetical protein
MWQLGLNVTVADLQLMQRAAAAQTGISVG